MRYIASKTKKPSWDSDDTTYYDRLDVWYDARMVFIDNELVDDAKFQQYLNEAVEEALVKGGSGNEFEEYVGRYYSRKSELQLKRGRIVRGSCSMDRSPRVHAVNIALLSAETVNWETFLRAHLDIMNDNFHRASDGSYAWGGRGTYIRELEELDIDVSGLLIGITLRLENPNKNHYYGSITRLGRALSETQNADEIESKMIFMIRDSLLDDYNRILIYYLFRNYNYYIADEQRKFNNEQRLQAAAETLPAYLSDKKETID